MNNILRSLSQVGLFCKIYSEKDYSEKSIPYLINYNDIAVLILFKFQIIFSNILLKGTRSFPGVLSYCMSKAALDQFTKCVALELADKVLFLTHSIKV